MLRLVSCLLLAATTLAAHRTSLTHIRPEAYTSSGAVYPIDYNDELTIKNPLVHPDANILFSFSQTRRDQPPQVDNREERLGNYMYRHPKSTTTTTPPLPETTSIESESESAESEEMVEIMFEPKNTQSANQYPETVPMETIPESTFTQPARGRYHENARTKPVMLPTGTTIRQPISNLHDFSSELEVPDSSRIDPAARYPPVDIWQPRARTSPPPVSAQTTSKIDLTTQPEVTEETPKTQTTSHRRHKPRHGNRGNAKWADVPALPVVPTVPAVALTSLPKLGSPLPPVPTLSPWYGDDFRK